LPFHEIVIVLVVADVCVMVGVAVRLPPEVAAPNSDVHHD
jgi:hypothetical protein